MSVGRGCPVCPIPPAYTVGRACRQGLSGWAGAKAQVRGLERPVGRVALPLSCRDHRQADLPYLDEVYGRAGSALSFYNDYKEIMIITRVRREWIIE